MPRILIVDDEPNIVTLISRYAQREGYDIVTAPDGREAIDKCKNEYFDVIIMDVMMPDTDGFTACKKIKEFKDIAPDELEHIWDRYYTKRQRSGKGVSGLELAIVKQIVSQHSGTCKAESEVGKGSTFRIELNKET